MAYPHTAGPQSTAYRWTDGQYYRPSSMPPAQAAADYQPGRQNTSQHHAHQQPGEYNHPPAQPPAYLTPPPPTGAGSEPPPGLHAVGPGVTPQPPGLPAHGNTEWHQCVICLGSTLADGLKVCAGKMPDHTTGRPQPAPRHHHHMTASTTRRQDEGDASAVVMPLSDGAVSACTGSRSISCSCDSDNHSDIGHSTQRSSPKPLPESTTAEQKRTPPPTQVHDGHTSTACRGTWRQWPPPSKPRKRTLTYAGRRTRHADKQLRNHQARPGQDGPDTVAGTVHARTLTPTRARGPPPDQWSQRTDTKAPHQDHDRPDDRTRGNDHHDSARSAEDTLGSTTESSESWEGGSEDCSEDRNTHRREKPTRRRPEHAPNKRPPEPYHAKRRPWGWTRIRIRTKASASTPLQTLRTTRMTATQGGERDRCKGTPIGMPGRR